MTLSRRQACIGLAGLLSGCDFTRDTIDDTAEWFDDLVQQNRSTPVPGVRQPVLPREGVSAADAAAAPDPGLPPAYSNPSWPQAGGLAEHVIGHVAAGGTNVAWRASAGTGANRSGRISAAPVVGGGRVFTMDAASEVRAFNAADGARIWRFDTEPDDTRSEGVGGGVAFDQNKIYATTGYAQVVALDATTGRLGWRAPLSAPARGAPTVGEGKVFAISVDGVLHALDAQSGTRLWSHSVTVETAGFYGASSPALSDGIVVAGFSSGDIVALRADSGRVLWTDALSGVVRTDAVTALADIRGLPAIDRGLVFVASSGGRIASIDLRTGGRNWERDVGSRQSPWIVGEQIFLTATDNRLVCLLRRDGRVRWARQLARYRNEERRRDPVFWTGPIVAGGRVILGSSRGEVLLFNPASGAPAGETRVSSGLSIPPIAAGGTLYLLTDNATLVALR